MTDHETTRVIEDAVKRALIAHYATPWRDSEGAPAEGNAYYQDLFELLDGDGAPCVKRRLLKRGRLEPAWLAPFRAGKEAMWRLSIGDFA